MDIYQILKHGAIKELFSANDVKPFRDHVFDIMLYTYFAKHNGMSNNIINDTDLVYTIDYDQIVKIRKELKNKNNNNKSIMTINQIQIL